MADIIRDGNGDPLIYLPITGLAAGQNSDPVPFYIDTPQVGKLTATLDDNAIVWVQRTSVGFWVDIAADPMDLSLVNEGVDTEFEIYIEAVAPITGLYRCPLSVVLGVGLPAGWVA